MKKEMKDFEILKAAIEQARIDLIIDNPDDNCEDVVYADLIVHNRYFALIFSHDFAKAFWGETKHVGSICGNEHTLKNKSICCKQAIKDCIEIYIAGWNVHLQAMVLEENPINYLEQFLTPQK